MTLNAIERYPVTPIWVRLYIPLYPVLVLALAYSFPDLAWLWVVAVFFGVVWAGIICVFLVTTFRREGYQAAIDDLAELPRNSED